jgi:homeobox protein DLX2
MDAPDAPHTPKYIDGGATGNAPGKSAFVELQQHG